MDKFFIMDVPKIKKKFIEMKDNNNKLKDIKNNNKNDSKKISKNTSWDNFMKFESFWLL